MGGVSLVELIVFIVIVSVSVAGVLLAINTAINVRAGDALHLASATANKATGLVSLDVGLLKSAKLLKLKPIAL
jgi:uncharacterized membrane protein